VTLSGLARRRQPHAAPPHTCPVRDPVAGRADARLPNPALLGNQLSLLYEGAAALSTSLDDPSPWTNARKAAATLIDQATA
jgi:hypothetical protein